MFVNHHLEQHTTKRDRELARRVWILIYFVCDYITLNKTELSNESFECHTIARAIALVIPELKLVDGVVLGYKRRGKSPYNYHSWLLTPDGAIIDPYPFWCLSDVILVPTKNKYRRFGGALYRKCKIRETRVSWSKIDDTSVKLAKAMIVASNGLLPSDSDPQAQCD